MLWCVYGGTGSGKTQFGGMADGILEAVKNRRKIFTNITGVEKRIAGICYYCHCPPSAVQIVKFTSDKNAILGEVLATLDDPANIGALWVLDEIRELFLANKKFNEWLSLRLNYMRKNRQDLIFIAQNPDYIDDDIKFLADGCSFFRRNKKWNFPFFGTSDDVRKEFLYNVGQPRLNRQKEPTDPDSVKTRKLDKRIEQCYISAIDEYTEHVAENVRAVNMWTGTKAKWIYAGILFFLFLVGVALFFIWRFSSIVDEFGEPRSKKVSSVSLSSQSSRALISSSSFVRNDSLCVLSSYAVNGVVTYKLNNGRLVNAQVYNDLLPCSWRSPGTASP